MKTSKIFLCLAIFGFFTLAASVLAATGDYVPLVKIPGVDDTGNFLNYLRDMYNFLISIVGILAMASLVYGGFRYLTSVGNPAAVEDAKDIINSAIIGLVLALSSWLILNEINPDVLVTSRKPGISGATDKYAYNQTPDKCVGNPSSAKSDAFSTIPYSETNPATFCTCIDQKTIPKKTKKAKLTLSVTNSTLAGSFINISGKLTDADTNAGISGDIKIKAISDSLGGMKTDPDEPSADSSGNFSYSTDAFTSCKGTFNVQAVFDGDTTYTSAGSDVKQLTVTTGGGFSDCNSGDFPIKPVTYWKADTCNSLCGDPNNYHCMKADLRVGDAPNPIGKSVTVKSGQAVYFDARTYSADYNYPNLKTNVPSDDQQNFNNGIKQYEICYDTNSSWPQCTLIAQPYGCADNLLDVCAVAWSLTGKTDGYMPCGITKTTYTTTTAKTIRARLRVISKNDCIKRYEDELQINVNP